MNGTQPIEEPFFISEEIEAEMIKAGYVFEPPKHISTTRSCEIPGFEYLCRSDEKPAAV